MTASEELLGSGTYAALYQAAPVSLMTLRVRDMVMVAANQAYLDMVGMRAEEVVGHHVFDVFPGGDPDPDSAHDGGNEDGASKNGGAQREGLRELFARAVETRSRAVAPVMRYDIVRGADVDVRWWSVSETPVLDAAGEVAYLLHHAEDVTELHRTREELVESRASERRSAAQVVSLSDVALALTGAQSVDDLEEIVVARGLSVLGSDGGGVVSRIGPDPADGWRVTVSPSLHSLLVKHAQVVDFDHPLPAVETARTGERLLLGTRAAGLAADPSMAVVHETTGRLAWACLPLKSRGRVLGCLAIGWREERVFTERELAVMEGFAAQCATALDRIIEGERQRRAADRVRHLAEALQRSMLTPPPRTDAVALAVRYRPANDLAQVGGDWYDTFVQPDGDVMVVIGDVSGHDDEAAGKMGQVRGLLRALAYDDRADAASPAGVLTRFEHVARGLRVDELATAVLGRIDGTPGPDGARELLWSNAGNPPPVMVSPEGRPTLLLSDRADLILGVDPETPRRDHRTRLAPGTTLLFYTDGLIERRDESIDRGLEDLQAILADLAGAPLDELCDQVLLRLDPHTGEDDIALVAVRV